MFQTTLHNAVNLVLVDSRSHYLNCGEHGLLTYQDKFDDTLAQPCLKHDYDGESNSQDTFVLPVSSICVCA